MGKRRDIESILILGAGPIVIGQACEFDYSGTQACRALREEGFRLILVNSNPATIMTDPSMADRIYIEPLRWQTLEQIIAVERPDALLSTMGGQTSLNVALALEEHGVLDAYGVELIGANYEAIRLGEDRALFKRAMEEIGLSTPVSVTVSSVKEAVEQAPGLGFPIILRPSFTLGGAGGGIAYNQDELCDMCAFGLAQSPIGQVLLERSVKGWKEYELEVVRDRKDNAIIVCSIENVDPMGIHTGDSITVAPAQTLTDREYHRLRDQAIAVLRRVGVDTGGANVQFAINPENGAVVVIEMNPRVSRSSALASKATGFPIARIAAKLAVGYTLDELRNEITGEVIAASFEPTLDYVVTKIPRFAFDKFPQADAHLTTQMKSVGEVMAFGRTFKESLHKALRSMEDGTAGLDGQIDVGQPTDSVETEAVLELELSAPGPRRLWYVADALRLGWSTERIHALTRIDPWFVTQIAGLVDWERWLYGRPLAGISEEDMRHLKRDGFSDQRLGHLLGCEEDAVRNHRHGLKIRPVYKRVDSCAAEFPAVTPYLYSTYEQYCESRPSQRRKIMVLGSGPNRIGQGIEFDYCCVHAALELQEQGIETIMVNCNPETVSTDFDISNRLYFEPLVAEDVLEIAMLEKPDGVIVQFGGQTPLKLCHALQAHHIPVLGTSPDSIDLAEDRERFRHLLDKLGLLQPPNEVAMTEAEALRKSAKIGFPLMIRPSYVLGGQAMRVVYDETDLNAYLKDMQLQFSHGALLLERFLENALELDVDAVVDKEGGVLVAGIMQHIEEAGIHSGDSACMIPPLGVGQDMQGIIKEQVTRLGRALGVVGLMNVQFALQGDELYVLEVNPRGSRTVPFVSKATGLALARLATRCMLGERLRDMACELSDMHYVAVKEAVFPFSKFAGADPVLGPEMKSTGEVMGLASSFGQAFAKAQAAAGYVLPQEGRILLSVLDRDKPAVVKLADQLVQAGYSIVATGGTARALHASGIACEVVQKVTEGRPHIVDLIKSNAVALIVNTTQGKRAFSEGRAIRREALHRQIPYFTTMAGAWACCQALAEKTPMEICCLQDVHKELKKT